jgi:hypothetical protein
VSRGLTIVVLSLTLAAIAAKLHMYAPAGEPTAVDVGCDASAPGTIGHSVWYTYTPTAAVQTPLSTVGSNNERAVHVEIGRFEEALNAVASRPILTP